MTMPRLSVAGLMVAIALLAVEFAALHSGSRLWFTTIYTLTSGLLLVAILVARYGRRKSGAFWFGFVVFGWGYFLLALGPWSSSQSGNPSDGRWNNPGLLTDRMIGSILDLVGGDADRYDSVTQFTEYTKGIAHLMVTLILAILGGIVAVSLSTARTAPKPVQTGAIVSETRRSKRKIIPFLVLVVLVLAGLLGSAAYHARGLGPYFPDRAFHQEADRNEFTVEWYSKHLEAMREPSLWKLSQGDRKTTTYRLLWLPSFDHPACVEISRSGKAVTLRVVVLNGNGGYEPGQIAIHKETKLGEERWNQLEHRLDQIAFWSMPTKLEDDGGSDGDQLILEGVKDGKYHIVDRWEPDPAYLDLCRFLFDLPGFQLKKALNAYHTNTRSPPN